MVYKLVVMQNKITISDNLISRRIHDQSYSLTGFNQLVIKDILDNYSYICDLAQCRTNCAVHNYFLHYLYLYASIIYPLH